MFSDAAHTAMTDTSGDIATVTTPAILTDTGEAFPGLPNHLVVAHILRSEYFDDPAVDLARLRLVSRAMRDAVAATGLPVEEFDEYEAAELGCLSGMKRLQRRGLLYREELFCEAEAMSGQLEELKLLRENGWPWDVYTVGRINVL
jgi:hypothetical protein